MNEGYVKFQCNWVREEISVPEYLFSSLSSARSQLYELGLIGMYPDGIGYGNISVKTAADEFLITGSATGQFLSLEARHYALVNAYNFRENIISCCGSTKASAESMTHAAVYEAIPEVGAVVHVHHLHLWEKLINFYPTTPETIEYGTPEMAESVRFLAQQLRFESGKVIIMGGHREGILSFGKSLEEATEQIIKIYNHYQND